MFVGLCIDEGFCNERDDGNYRNLNICFGYIVCFGGIVYEMFCVDGLMFDEDENVCDYLEIGIILYSDIFLI